MSHKQIKWLILLIPTLTIGLWEYVRHNFLLHVLSMEMGNWLAPVIVLIVTLLLLTKLFSIMEKMQEELALMKSTKTALQERDHMAKELHDGIAQSLFLLSVKVDQLEKRDTPQAYEGLRKIIHEVNTYVRQAISNLRYPLSPSGKPWLEGLQQLSLEIKDGSDLDIKLDWTIPAEKLTLKEKIELSAIIREALLNVRKHSGASEAIVEGKETDKGWLCRVIDDGSGFEPEFLDQTDKYGLTIMKERASAMGWSCSFRRSPDKMTVEITNALTKETVE